MKKYLLISFLASLFTITLILAIFNQQSISSFYTNLKSTGINFYNKVTEKPVNKNLADLEKTAEVQAITPAVYPVPEGWKSQQFNYEREFLKDLNNYVQIASLPLVFTGEGSSKTIMESENTKNTLLQIELNKKDLNILANSNPDDPTLVTLTIEETPEIQKFNEEVYINQSIKTGIYNYFRTIKSEDKNYSIIEYNKEASDKEFIWIISENNNLIHVYGMIENPKDREYIEYLLQNIEFKRTN